MRLPSKKRPGHPILAKDWNLLIDALEARTPRPSVGLELVFSSGGFAYRAPKSKSDRTGNAAPCAFGEIIQFKENDTEKTGIRGGVIYAGDKVWNVAHRALNLEASGTFKVWVEVAVKGNVEDGVLLPGLETSSAPEWKQASDEGNYPDQEMPELPSGNGKAIIAIGILTIEEGRASLERVGCGAIQITHCPGTLGHTRI